MFRVFWSSQNYPWLYKSMPCYVMQRHTEMSEFVMDLLLCLWCVIATSGPGAGLDCRWFDGYLHWIQLSCAEIFVGWFKLGSKPNQVPLRGKVVPMSQILGCWSFGDGLYKKDVFLGFSWTSTAFHPSLENYYWSPSHSVLHSVRKVTFTQVKSS